MSNGFYKLDPRSTVFNFMERSEMRVNPLVVFMIETLLQ